MPSRFLGVSADRGQGNWVSGDCPSPSSGRPDSLVNGSRPSWLFAPTQRTGTVLLHVCPILISWAFGTPSDWRTPSFLGQDCPDLPYLFEPVSSSLFHRCSTSVPVLSLSVIADSNMAAFDPIEYFGIALGRDNHAARIKKRRQSSLSLASGTPLLHVPEQRQVQAPVCTLPFNTDTAKQRATVARAHVSLSLVCQSHSRGLNLWTDLWPRRCSTAGIPKGIEQLNLDVHAKSYIPA